GLHFERSDPAALARAIKRAATEPGLRQRLPRALPAPPPRADLIDRVPRVYRARGAAAAARGARSGLVGENAPSPALGAHENVPRARRAKARQRSMAPVMSQGA